MLSSNALRLATFWGWFVHLLGFQASWPLETLLVAVAQAL